MVTETEKALEEKIVNLGLSAPRLTPDHIDKLIVFEDYHVFETTGVTVCCLKLENGFSVVGESAPVSLENFDHDIGREIARKNAREKIWQLEGYLLKQRMYEEAIQNERDD